MYLVIMMYEDPDLDGRSFAAVCEWNEAAMWQVVHCAKVASEANEKSASVKHVAFNALPVDVYEVHHDLDDNGDQNVVTDDGRILFWESQQWCVTEQHPFEQVNDEPIRTELDDFLVRVVRDASGRAAILSFSWEVYEKHSAARINSFLIRATEMVEMFKRLSGPLPATIRLGHEVFSQEV